MFFWGHLKGKKTGFNFRLDPFALSFHPGTMHENDKENKNALSYFNIEKLYCQTQNKIIFLETRTFFFSKFVFLQCSNKNKQKTPKSNQFELQTLSCVLDAGQFEAIRAPIHRCFIYGATKTELNVPQGLLCFLVLIVAPVFPLHSPCIRQPSEAALILIWLLNPDYRGWKERPVFVFCEGCWPAAADRVSPAPAGGSVRTNVRLHHVFREELWRLLTFRLFPCPLHLNLAGGARTSLLLIDGHIWGTLSVAASQFLLISPVELLFPSFLQVFTRLWRFYTAAKRMFCPLFTHPLKIRGLLLFVQRISVKLYTYIYI